MLKVLLKKQLTETFRSYFYDSRKNRTRSLAGTVALFALFAVIMVGVLGGIFTALSVSLCAPMVTAGAGWMYFTVMGGLSLVLGIFGSVFNSYASLYLSKDNDLLLSMPVPVRLVILSRLINVYLLGAMYTSVALVPTLFVYWVTAGITASRIVCGLLFLFGITVLVLIFACLLGWCVAKISLKLKHRAFVVVAGSLAFIGLYYLFYFKAQTLFRAVLTAAVAYGGSVRGPACALLLFGRAGEGNIPATLLFLAVLALLAAGTWLLLKKTFLSIATDSGKTDRRVYREKLAKQSSPFGALLTRELSCFLSDPNYMLNCGLGILFIPAAGILLLIKQDTLIPALQNVFRDMPGATCILICTALMMLCSLVDTAAPSVSLEGKCIWIPQSLPVAPRTVLWAKTVTNLILTAVPVLFAVICAELVMDDSVADQLLCGLVALLNALFYSSFCSFAGILVPNLTWTNSIVPIKQGGAVALALFAGGWGVAALFAVPYFLIGYRIGTTAYLIIWVALLSLISLIILNWLETKGAERFASL